MTAAVYISASEDHIQVCRTRMTHEKALDALFKVIAQLSTCSARPYENVKLHGELGYSFCNAC
jgi:hypothetical protein